MENTALQAPAANLALVKEKQKLVRIGDQSVSVKGYRMDFFEEHVEDHRFMNESQHWCSPQCMSRVIFGRDSKKNRTEVRKRLPRTFKEMLKRSRFLAIEYAPHGGGHHGEAIAFRFILPDEEGLAKEWGKLRLRKMQRHLNITQEELAIAERLLGVSATV